VGETFSQAFGRLMSRAPGPVFPRARSLYLRKYPLETEAEGSFRTFLLEEEIHESPQGAVRSRALAFAVVHWQGPQVDRAVYAAYLDRRWAIHPPNLVVVPQESWFRGGGAWARFSLPVVFERSHPTTLLSSPGDPEGAGNPGGPGA
jgi:hypothetical protein